MPVASSSRRKTNTRRRISSDIEEDRPTQGPADEEVDESEDERPRTKSTKKDVKKETKAAGKQRAADSTQVEEESEDEQIDVENFVDQPLRKDDVSKLSGLSSDWTQMEATIRQNWTTIGDVANAVAETADGDERDNSLAQLDRDMRDFLDIGEEMKAHAQTLKNLHQLVLRGEEVDDARDRYLTGVKTIQDDYAMKTTRQKYAKSEVYVQFRSGIYEVLNPDKPMPPITDFIAKEPGDVSDDEDDLEIGGVVQSYTCPISLTALEKPMTSTVCGHSFSEDSIRQSFRNAHAATKCPAAGCNKSFRLSDLKPNKDLAKKVKAWQRRQERAAEHSDAEEVSD